MTTFYLTDPEIEKLLAAFEAQPTPTRGFEIVRWLQEARRHHAGAADPAPTDPAWTIDDDGNPRCGDVATVVASTHRGVAVRCDTTGTTAVFPMEAHAALVALIRSAAAPAPTDPADCPIDDDQP